MIVSRPGNAPTIHSQGDRWRTLGTLDTFAINWFMTGKIEIAGSIAALEIVTKIGWYYLRKRVWAAIAWG